MANILKLLDFELPNAKICLILLYRVTLWLMKYSSFAIFVNDNFLSQQFKCCALSRYVRQFREIFTEEGRRQVKITHQVPGRAPVVTYTQVCNVSAMATTKSTASSADMQPTTSTAQVNHHSHHCYQCILLCAV